MKALQSITIEVGVLSAARDNINNISQFCEDALATHLNIMKKTKVGIPPKKLMENTITEQRQKIAILKEKIKQLEKQLPVSKGSDPRWGPPRAVVLK